MMDNYTVILLRSDCKADKSDGNTLLVHVRATSAAGAVKAAKEGASEGYRPRFTTLGHHPDLTPGEN